ncbi:MAG: glycosyltransferase family 2 protein [Phocaeicola sp.]|uniref:glycosyltransferase family 2 protein n=1 Tax=Phocaeicola TaxID=909656 RepID=UPI00234EF6E8|nr:glycosyltransferase family 2 protein [Phocaeicola oris]MCE2617191.1 glycosyltransferase family 2 protein [Phocaeicola oris]
MSETLTIFTPAFNRAHTLLRTYQSLCRQTCQDFEWLIVDDGSTDNTKELVDGWIEENKISIRYIHQENQGMHGAHNMAYRNITTELNTCIDSDDYMPDDAVEKIVSLWREKGSEKYAGIIGLDAKINGSIIGQKFLTDLEETTLRGYYEDLHGTGDKKLVYRTDVITKYPEYPLFKGEKYFALAYKYYMVDCDYPLLVSNDIYVIVDYQKDGSSMGMWKQYWNNPKGFAFFRRFDMMQTKSIKRKWIDNIHYVSHSIRFKNIHFLKESPMKIMTFFSIVPGLVLYEVNRYKVKVGKLYKV